MKRLVIALSLFSLITGCAMVGENTFQKDLIGEWRIEMIKDRPVIDNSPASLRFGADNSLSGSASCNRLSTSYSVSGYQVALSQGAVTRMMCPPALMEQEGRLLAAMDDVRSGRIENGMLYLEGESGELIYKAAPVTK